VPNSHLTSTVEYLPELTYYSQSRFNLARQYPGQERIIIVNIIDLRKNLRASAVHRLANDRRQNPHPYGTPEWLEFIRNHGQEQPDYDRRKTIRRASDQPTSTATDSNEKPYKRILLTPAEKNLLLDIYFTDIE